MLKHRYPDRVEVCGGSFTCAQTGRPRGSRENCKGFIVTHIITVRKVRTLSVNGRMPQHRTVSGKHIDAQTSIPGPRRSILYSDELGGGLSSSFHGHFKINVQC